MNSRRPGYLSKYWNTNGRRILNYEEIYFSFYDWAMALSLAACSSSTAATSTASAATTSGSSASGDHTLTVYAWDKNFNIPALQAAEADYQKNVDPDFKLNIIEQSQSSDVENAITLAGSSGDYSSLPDIVLFQDHYIQNTALGIQKDLV